MKVVQNIRPDTGNTTSCNVYNSYITSAIPVNADNYIYLEADKICCINTEDTGKYSVFDIANWFLYKGEMTVKKMQKLCYYAQAWCYALKGYRLENTDFQAWVDGPASPALWERFKAFGYNPIRIKGRYTFEIDKEDLKLLEDVWDTYGEDTGNSLEVLSQRELPWIEARKGYEPDEKCSVVISPGSMASYYKSVYCGN